MHSRRNVPISRSQRAFAWGHWGGVVFSSIVAAGSNLVQWSENRFIAEDSHSGRIFFRPPMVKGSFCVLTNRAAFLFRGNVEIASRMCLRSCGQVHRL